MALAVALGRRARTPTLPAPQRSQYRAEARSLLEQLAGGAGGGAHAVAAMYNCAVINAEGGHYDDAVAGARAALQLASSADAGGSGDGYAIGLLLALLALLLSARQQVPAALQVADAGLSPGGPVRSRAAGGAAPDCGWGEDDAEVLLMRVKTQLLLATADVNGALAVLGAAKRRLTLAHSAAEAAGRGGDAASFKQQEAQVWRELALTYAGQVQAEDARYCIEAAEKLEPYSAATLHAAGAVHEAGGDMVAASDAYWAALALDSAHAPALLSLGTLLRRQGTPPELAVASGLLSDALRYVPHNPVGWYNLGLVHKAQGATAAAEQHLFSAVTLAAAAPVLSYSALPLLLP